MSIFQNTHYLGHRISANGLEPLPEKLEAIKNLAPTRNVDEAHQILGLLGCYRSFVEAFANITLPITSLLKKSTPFVWSNTCQLALEYIKEIFCKNHYYNSWTLINHTYCIQMHPIMCIQAFFAKQLIMILGQLHIFSGTFTAQNRSWGATEKEAYAVLKGMQHFDYYL